MVPTATHTRVLAVALALVAVGGIAFAGSAFGQIDDDGEADLRLVHASPDAPPVDVYVNGERVLEEMEYGTLTDYMTISAGSNHVVVIASEPPGTVVFEGDVIVDADGSYTLAASGEVGPEGGDNVQPVALEENATEPASGIGAIRMVHLSPDAPGVTVTLNNTDTVVFDNVGFGESSPYMTIPEGSYELDVHAGGPDAEVVDTLDVDVTGGQAQSMFVHGYVDPPPTADDVSRELEVITTTDPTGPTSTTPDINPQPIDEADEPEPDTEPEPDEEDEANATD